MRNILTINAGSSSIRFALFALNERPRRLLSGKVERIGTPKATLSGGRVGEAVETLAIDATQPDAAINELVAWLSRQKLAPPDAVGHRVVHGMQRSEPERVTPALLQALRRMQSFDPEHLPREIELIEAMQRAYPDALHVACFDTAFHRSMPLVATQLPLPRRFAAQGLQRYGFHGLSYRSLLQQLAQLGDGSAARGRIILAHLGGGASMAAVRDGHCIDTSMGFTPTSGLVMGTRTGDLDPGLMSYLLLTGAMNATQFQTMVNHESGLLGVSQSSADVRDLLAAENQDSRAREALALFCYQAKKCIGAFAAALGGLQTLVFAGGIGEHAAPIRSRICEQLGFLGVEVDPQRNAAHAALISPDNTPVAVRVIATDEEIVIAEMSANVLGGASPGDSTCSQKP